MQAARLDVLCITSKHTVHYLRGGYLFISFVTSRYLPVLIYQRGNKDHTTHIGNNMEGGEHALRPFQPVLDGSPFGTLAAQNGKILVPVKLERLARLKDQWHKGAARCGLARPLPVKSNQIRSPGQRNP